MLAAHDRGEISTLATKTQRHKGLINKKINNLLERNTKQTDFQTTNYFNCYNLRDLGALWQRFMNNAGSGCWGRQEAKTRKVC